MSKNKAICIGCVWIGVGLSAFGAGVAVIGVAIFAMLATIVIAGAD